MKKKNSEDYVKGFAEVVGNITDNLDIEHETEDIQMPNIETLSKQLEEKEQQLDEYVSDLKNDIFSDEAEKLRKEIYELQDKIDILKRKKMDEADGIFKKLGISVDLYILENLISDFRYNQITLDCVFKELDAEDIQAIENLVQSYKQQVDIIKNSISKDRIKEVLDNKFVVFYEGEADSPDWATKINKVKYINAKHLQELLEGDE